MAIYCPILSSKILKFTHVHTLLKQRQSKIIQGLFCFLFFDNLIKAKHCPLLMIKRFLLHAASRLAIQKCRLKILG